MRRALTTVTVVSALFLAASSLAAEKQSDAPPPPPPPPPASSESPPPPPPPADDSSSTSDTPSGSSLRAQDALLDASGGKKRPLMLSFFAGIPYYYFWNCGYYGGCGFPISLGARFAYPILHDGFLPMLNDSFEIEGGIDANLYLGSSYPLGIAIFVTPRWTFHLIPKLSVYAAPINIGFVIYAGRPYSAFDFVVNPAVGALFQISQAIYLRAELGVYYVRAGLGIAF